MTDITLFRSFPITKADRLDMIEQLKEDFLSGNYNPLELEIRLKSLQDVVDAIRKDKDVKDYILDEADKYGKGEAAHGAKVTIVSRKSYDYKTTGDEVYLDLVDQKKKLDAMIKAREKMLLSGVNPETGESYPEVPFNESRYLKVEWLDQ